MSQKKIVLGIIGKAIEKYGFRYEEVKERGIWIFKRNKEDVEQEIFIQKNPWRKELEMSFDTTAWRWNSCPVHANSLIPQNQYADQLKAWLYQDEKEFRRIVEEFLEIIEKYGLNKLDEMSIEEEVIPTEEMGKKLFYSYEELSEAFVTRNELSIACNSIENIKQCCDIFDRTIKDTAETSYEDVQEILIEMAAFLGERLRAEVGGKWMVPVNYQNVFLCELDCYVMKVYPILLEVVDAWRRKSTERLRQKCIYALDSKLPVEMEQMLVLQERLNEISKL